MMHTMIAGVGYQNLRDLSVGPVLVPSLAELNWPAGVEVDDWSFGPIAVVQRLQDRPGYYDGVILITAVQRGREPGSITSYRWDGALPSADEIQARIGEAVTGVISIDNLLIVAEHFKAWPPEVHVLEVEPEDPGWGPGFTPRVAAAIPKVIEQVRELVERQKVVQ